MTVTPVEGLFSGRTEIPLPGRPYVAVRNLLLFAIALRAYFPSCCLVFLCPGSVSFFFPVGLVRLGGFLVFLVLVC